MTAEERLPDPELLRQGGFRVATKLFAPGDIRGTQQQVDRIREFAQAEDPAADAVIALFDELPSGQGRRMFEQALEDGIDSLDDPPEVLTSFFRTVENTPYWVDDDSLERGARAIVRTGLLSLFPLGDLSLMGGYLASRATKSLVGTGSLEYATNRRLQDTAQWWLDVTTPGALHIGGKGYAAALRVRLVHAYVRAAMHRRDDWDYAAWDRPVNQVQTVGTLMLFSLVYVVGMQLLGVRYTEQERADIHHLWRYIGWLMGVSEELLPTTEEESWRLLWLLAATEFIPDEDSKRLAAALLQSYANAGRGGGVLHKIASHSLTRVHSSISRLILGRSNADFLELPHYPIVQGVVLAAAATNFTAETVRRWVPGATQLQERFGAAGRRRYDLQLKKLSQRRKSARE